MPPVFLPIGEIVIRAAVAYPHGSPKSKGRSNMPDAIPVAHVEQVALWKQWVAEKQRGVPSALRAWEKDLLCWNARQPLDPQLWISLQAWAQRSGLIERPPPRAPRSQYRGEL